uniref:Uncharacterized protein n=1 Tax=viral metagenome TaxID=1070528 RepID=A0A6C0APB1_9ZZZZ
MGLVLVFDLDGTIIDSSDRTLFNIEDTAENFKELKTKIRNENFLNSNLLYVFKRAAYLRRIGKVTAILLLTNNSDNFFISVVDSVLRDICSEDKKIGVGANGQYKNSEYIALNRDPYTEMREQEYFFDSILPRTHTNRRGSDLTNPIKGIDDIKLMLGFLNKEMSEGEILENTFFFDDLDHEGMHPLGDNYIRITPGFKKGVRDETIYNVIFNKLEQLEKPSFGRTRSNTANSGNVETRAALPNNRTIFTPITKRKMAQLLKPKTVPTGGSKLIRTRRTRRANRNKMLRINKNHNKTRNGVRK